MYLHYSFNCNFSVIIVRKIKLCFNWCSFYSLINFDMHDRFWPVSDTKDMPISQKLWIIKLRSAEFHIIRIQHIVYAQIKIIILTHICCKIEQLSKNNMKSIKQASIAVADPEGVRGVQTNPLLSLIYFIFMWNFRKNWSNCTNRTPLANLNPRSKNPGSAPELHINHREG